MQCNKTWSVLVLCMVFLILVVSSNGAAAKEEVRITARDNARYESDSKFFTLEGEVKVHKGDMVISADTARISIDDNIAYLNGDVQLTQDDTVIVSQTLTVFFEQDMAVFDGGVNLTKADDGIDLTVTSLEFHLDTLSFVCQGDVYILKAGNHVYADEGSYNKERNQFNLLGNVRIHTENGDILNAPEVVMYVEGSSFDAVGGVEVLFKVEKDNSNGESIGGS